MHAPGGAGGNLEGAPQSRNLGPATQARKKGFARGAQAFRGSAGVVRPAK